MRVLDVRFASGRQLGAGWRTCYPWSCTIATSGEVEWYQAANVTVRSSALALTARAQRVHGRPFTSGMVQSRRGFDFRYGLVVVTAKVPVVPGAWPALWMLPADGTWPPEIDIMEFYGSAPGSIIQTLHLGADDRIDQQVVRVASLGTRFHRFAVDWEPHSVTWFVDGRRTFQVRASLPVTMYLLADLAVQAGTVPSSPSYPASFEVRSIEVFQHPGVGSVECAMPACAG
ncbi:MAG TPA: glycoside hydrolase family 16 protein [Acidimicrobiales bacterium]|nr:glycoside hydrolase family 16 protein [Acidimicrobiales bacterium]